MQTFLSSLTLLLNHNRCALAQWSKYKFGGSGTVKMPGAPCFVLGAHNRLSVPDPDFGHLLQEVDTCTV